MDSSAWQDRAGRLRVAMITEKNGGIGSAPDLTLASFSMEWMDIGSIAELLARIWEWSEIPNQSGAASYYWPHPYPVARSNTTVSGRRREPCRGSIVAARVGSGATTASAMHY